jgi:hypothetical protein
MNAILPKALDPNVERLPCEGDAVCIGVQPKGWLPAPFKQRALRAIEAAVGWAGLGNVTGKNGGQLEHWLEQASGPPRVSIPYLPICSNLGKPQDLVPWSNRFPQDVSFGGATIKELASSRCEHGPTHRTHFFALSDGEAVSVDSFHDAGSRVAKRHRSHDIGAHAALLTGSHSREGVPT